MREATLTLRRDSLLHNTRRVRELAPATRVLAMVKADAYGHGALTVAAQLTPHVDALGVAYLDEGLALRDAGISAPIVVMEGVFSAYELASARAKGMHVMVHQASQLQLLEENPGLSPLPVWLKVDSGMHRLGFRPDEVPEVYRRLESLPGVSPVILTSHFACADLPGHPMTARQLETMRTLHRALPAMPLSLANSAAILTMPETHGQWVRPGIMLYGSSPFADRSAESLGLQPVMTLRSRVIALRDIAAGESVGYGATWTAEKPSRIGVIAIGYGDGYPRHAPTGTPVLVNDRIVPLVGRVSMDMITVDLADLEVSVGDEAVLWGEGLSADIIAAHAGTISYTLFCQVTARVAREWV